MRSAPLVGYYVHHQGRGHLHRALALGRELAGRGIRLAFLSSLPRPPGLAAAAGDDVSWLELARDDDGSPVDVSPGGLLHWAPRGHDGLRSRMSAISLWIRDDRPDLVISDVSQEVTLLSRLHGVPVVSVVLPGERGDAAHRLGLGVSDRLVGFWPAEADRMVSGLPEELAARLVAVGAMSRLAVDTDGSGARRVDGVRRLLVLSGRGGGDWPADELTALSTRAPDWGVEVLGRTHWVDDPRAHLTAADVVLTRAGQASVAEVAATRVPAIVVPARRPHAEQQHTAAQLDRGPWPVLVRPTLAEVTPEDLTAAAELDGAGWSTWCDGGAAGRFAGVVESLLDRPAPAASRRASAS